ncbi:MAG: hypothetical protein MSC31_00090 [Solirubrobacteraceae bacterium MAG38_C4-C5]|nr:hypothetical protein [Candidatus Siliceabacter maunaloa]
MAWVSGDLEGVAGAVSDEIRWDRVGERVLKGRSEFERSVTETAADNVARLVINTIITHGATAAVNGAIELDSASR